MKGSQTKFPLVQEHPKISSLQKLSTGMVLASALWRRSFWKHYQAHSRLHEGKKQNTQLQSMRLNLRKEINGAKTWNDMMKVSRNFISLRFHLQN